MSADRPVENRDPDKLDCYSDHASDIAYKGECDMCGSTEVNVIGHILPDMERLTGLDPVQAAEAVLSGGAKIIDGAILDHFTAAHIKAVYDALSTDEAKAKMRSLSLMRAAEISFKLVAQQEERG